MRRRFLLALAIAAVTAGLACDTAQPRSAARATTPLAPSGTATTDDSAHRVVVSWSCLAASAAQWQPTGCVPTGAKRLTLSGAALSAPSAPFGLTGSVLGNTVFLEWHDPSGDDRPTSYVVEAGSRPGLSDLANADLGSVASTLVANAVPSGTYYIRIRARNAAGLSSPSNEIALVVGGGVPCPSAPAAPTSLVATATGSAVTLTWAAPSGGCATGYVIEAGSAPGSSNVATVNTGTSATVFTAAGVGAGTYYIRVRAVNALGSSAASNEVALSVGGTAPCTAPPVAPTNFTAAASGATVSLLWTGSPDATSYVIEAGSASGLSNILVSDTGGTATSLVTTAGAGTYFVRIRAKNTCGVSSPSNEAVLVVGANTAVLTPTLTR
jgi:hypothetical protein